MQLINIKQLKGFYNTFMDSVSTVVPTITIVDCEEISSMFVDDEIAVHAVVEPSTLSQEGVWTLSSPFLSFTSDATEGLPNRINLLAEGVGTYTLTFTSNGYSESCEITVTAP